MKTHLSEGEKQKITKTLQKICAKFPSLHLHQKTKLLCYHRAKGKTTRLAFYINPRIHEVVFGIGHHGTDILEKHPVLRTLADETKISVMKFSIKKYEDIEKKALENIIALILT